MDLFEARMSFSPTKQQRTLSRQPSSPSLAVGLPPELPSSNVMAPSSPQKKSKKNRRKNKKVHRGDVESSTESDMSSVFGGGESEVDCVGEPGIVASSSSSTIHGTPKRKVIAVMDIPKTVAVERTKKREDLQARLKGAAIGGITKSRSTGDGLSAAAAPDLFEQGYEGSGPSTAFAGKLAKAGRMSGAHGPKASDKVLVCVRIKPTSSAFASTSYELTPTSLTLADSHPNVLKRGGKAGREDEYTYTFDKLLQQPDVTPHLYAEKIAPLVDKAMHGFNSTIFAYGQTGSGKSYTMTGTAAELGIIPCAVDGVFDAITEETDRAYLLRVSYIEIYNETLRDLLNPKKGPLKDDEKPAIHFNKGKVWVEPLVEEIVSTPQDVVDLLEKGNASRRIGATDWNERSSRSHTVFTIVIESRPRDGSGDHDIRLSRLNLIDLAGSEKAVSDLERRGEGKHINQSLLALREVINKLTEKKRYDLSHIPYRNSKLTHLLENALGGDSNICVICTISAEEEHCSETLETLKFAGRCSQVETKAKKNVLQSSEQALIRAKDQEIDDLKRRLMAIEGSGHRESLASEAADATSELAESVAELEARKARLTAKLAKLNGEILTSELPRSASGLPTSPVRPKRRRISDFSTMVGLGTPRAKLGGDRRAVSGMPRLVEDPYAPLLGGAMETAGVDSKLFDHDRIIAGLRKSLAAKEQELAQVTSDLAALQGQILDTAAEHDAAMSDFHVKLESTRAELVSTIDDKNSKIDQLEAAILELRQSREDLAVEDQVRLDALKTEMAALTAKLEQETAERAQKGDELEKLASARDEEVRKMLELQASLADLELERTNLTEALSAAQSEKQEADRLRSEAAQELERHQQAAMSTQDESLAELRAELAKAQEDVERLEADKAAAAKKLSEEWVMREELRTAMEVERRRAEQGDKALEAFKAASIGNEAATQELRFQMAELENRHKAELAARAENDTTAQLQSEIDEIRTRTDSTIAALTLELEQARQEADKSRLHYEADLVALRETHAKELSEAQAARGSSDDDLAKARDEALHVTQERDALRLQIEDLNRARGTADEALAQAREEAIHATQERDALQLQVEEISKIRDELQAARGSDADATRQTEQRLQEAVELGLKHDAKRIELESRIAALEVDAAALQEQQAEASRLLVEKTTEAGDLADQLESARKSSAELEQEAQKIRSDLSARDAEAVAAFAEIDSLKASLEEASKQEEQLRNENSRQAAAHSEVVAQIESLQTQLKAMPNDEIVTDLRAHLEQRAAQCTSDAATIEGLKQKLSAAERTLSEERQRSAEVEAQRRSLAGEMETLNERLAAMPSSDAMDKLQSELDNVTQQLASAESSLKSRSEELCAASAEKDVANEKIAATEVALATAREEIASLIAAKAATESELAARSADLTSIRARLSEVESSVDDRDKALAEQRAEVQRLQVTTSELESTRAKLQDSDQALFAAQEKLSSAEAERSAAVSQLEVLKGNNARLQTAIQAAPTSEAMGKLAAELDLARAAEKAGVEQIDSLQERVKHLGEEIARLVADLDALPKADHLKDLETKLTAAQAETASTKNALTAAELTIGNLQAEALDLRRSIKSLPTQAAFDGLTKELEAAKSKAGISTKKLVEMEKEAHARRDEIARLKSQLAAKPDDAAVAELRAALQAAQAEIVQLRGEVERLEKEIEEKQAVIMEQKTKIAAWHEDLEAQKELVRKLTADPGASPTNSTPGSRHVKTRSLHVPLRSHESPPASPSAGLMKGKAYMSSTFTAVNLALPSMTRTLQRSNLNLAAMDSPGPRPASPDKPSPLPRHPSQASNATARKARRVTIEHDIETLSDTSRVLRAKKIFDSPDKVPSPADMLPKRRRA